MASSLISNPDKVLFAGSGETKGDLAEHYLRVGEPLMRTMGGRPVLLRRFPEGAAAPAFFQKRVPKNNPGSLQNNPAPPPHRPTAPARRPHPTRPAPAPGERA